jgi:diguanylate cyclase (GGDEF)-like protein
VLRDGRPTMGKPMHGRATGRPLIIFAAPVRDASSRIVTVLAGVAWLNSAGFLDRMQETKLGMTGGFLLVSPADKLFVAASDRSMILKPTPAVGVNPLHDRAMAGYRGTGITVNAYGIEELSAMVSVPSAGWFVVARMPTSEAFSVVETLRGFMLTASLLMLVFMLAVLLVMLPRILRPLTDAANAMRDMAKGERKLEALEVVRDDEVGKLVSGFNVLVDRLAREEDARRASEERLQFLAHHDSLTGLHNRAMLEDRMEQGLARAERDGSQVALLFCDLDGFKMVNDLYGHDAGDAVLRQVAQRLSLGRRKMDTVARLGGDEFVILLVGLGDARVAAEAVARQCLAAIAEPFEFEGRRYAIGMSIGIALHAGLPVAPSYLLSQADIAMYHAKSKGKGNFFFIDEVSAVHGGQTALHLPAVSLLNSTPD